MEWKEQALNASLLTSNPTLFFPYYFMYFIDFLLKTPSTGTLASGGQGVGKKVIW